MKFINHASVDTAEAAVPAFTGAPYVVGSVDQSDFDVRQTNYNYAYLNKLRVSMATEAQDRASSSPATWYPHRLLAIQ